MCSRPRSEPPGSSRQAAPRVLGSTHGATGDGAVGGGGNPARRPHDGTDGHASSASTFSVARHSPRWDSGGSTFWTGWQFCLML